MKENMTSSHHIEKCYDQHNIRLSQRVGQCLSIVLASSEVKREYQRSQNFCCADRAPFITFVVFNMNAIHQSIIT